MNVASLIEKIAGRQKERQQQNVQSYRDLVKQVAGGKEPDPVSVWATLEAAGKSLNELQKAVKLYEQRMAWKAQVAMQASLEKKNSSDCTKKWPLRTRHWKKPNPCTTK